ncbi:MAG: class I SAM-dependent methyltransferase [Candidatus Andersenbacteria bacterium]|nr:class I SAM-dependent methyltransferase [Candidatus Andersenbacteria bacterium]MBI3250254.1 class I SAM-dependent methyltransferase [Candidatus Andersenbacteria bacterium]
MTNVKSAWDTLWKRPENTLFASGPSFRHKLRIFLKLVRTYGPGNKVLDIACGTGELLRALPTTYEMTGTDISQLALDKASGFSPEIRWQLLNIENDSLPEKFSMIFCTNALEEMSDDVMAIKNMAAMLEKDGRLFIITPHRKKYWTRKDKEAGNKRRYERTDMAALLQSAHLRPVVMKTWGWPLYRIWYRLMTWVNQDTLWNNQTKKTSASLASRLAYIGLFIDDLFSWTNQGSILFVIAEHVD